MFIIDDILSGSVQALHNKQSFFQAIFSKINESWLIWKGLFLTDKQLPTLKRCWLLISRWSWELPQTLLGFICAVLLHWTNRVESIRHLNGATTIKLKGLFGGLSLSPYIIGDDQLVTTVQNHIFQHEFGHQLQSQIWGPLFLIVIGMPSLMSAMVNDYDKHMSQWQEQDSNKRSKRYFLRKNLSAFVWDEAMNPILNA